MYKSILIKDTTREQRQEIIRQEAKWMTYTGLI